MALFERWHLVSEYTESDCLAHSGPLLGFVQRYQQFSYHCFHVVIVNSDPERKTSDRLIRYENNFYSFTYFRGGERAVLSFLVLPLSICGGRIGPGLETRARSSVHVPCVGGMDGHRSLPSRATLAGGWGPEPEWVPNPGALIRDVGMVTRACDNGFNYFLFCLFVLFFNLYFHLLWEKSSFCWLIP